MAGLSTMDALRDFVGAESVDEQGGQVVVSPRTVEELAAVMQYANSNELAVDVAGAGTKRDWGNPVDAKIVLKSGGLAGISHHSWQDLTATVGAGTAWAAMQKALAVHSQQVALDPLWPETATIGGVVATNDSGALRLRYGSLRDLIIGMTIVLADGAIAKSGGKVVKNVAGYDLHKLMTGAFGTLGVIAEVTFRLHPICAHSATFTVRSAEVEPLGELMLKVLDSQLSTQAMQLRAGREQYALDVRLASLPQVLEVQSGQLRELVKAVSSFLEVEVGEFEVFAVRESLFSSAEDVIVKVTTVPTEIAKLSREVVRLGGTAVTQASGIMFARFEGESAIRAVTDIRERVRGFRDGSVTVLRAPRRLASLRETEVLPLMRELKRQFDPKRILNPARFVGGI